MEDLYLVRNKINLLLSELDCILQNLRLENNDVSTLAMAKVDNIQASLRSLYEIFSVLEKNLAALNDVEILQELVKDLFSLITTSLIITSLLSRTNNMVLKSSLVSNLLVIEDQTSRCISKLKEFYG